jgi:hypothetical protein
MGFHNRFYGSQSQDKTLYFCSDSASMKGEEDVRKVVGGNPCQGDNTSAPLGKLDRVIQEIVKHPPQLEGIQGNLLYQIGLFVNASSGL